MAEWEITDEEIETIEKLLLQPGKHFADDAKEVIRFWGSTDVAACPGSGKTTVLLAKLKLIADRMPLENGSGICVLSHTNVAVDEIKAKLSSVADKLLSYPNFIGTIQSFVDKYVTMQYIRGRCKTNLQFVSDKEYAHYLYKLIWRDKSRNSPYYSLRYYIRKRIQAGNSQYTNEEKYYQNIVFKQDGIYHQGIKLAGPLSDSYKQYKKAKQNLLINEGMLLYSDTYVYANEAIDALSKDYTDLFSKRFKYIFIDEYQDCDANQRLALEKIFDASQCRVIRIGDSDQAIYNGLNGSSDWIPQSNCMSIASSCRYSQEIANILSPLRKNGKRIDTSSGPCGYKPVIIVFDDDNPTCVIQEYANQVIRRGLNEANETHYAVGFRRESSSGLTVGSYWNGFDSTKQAKDDLSYWLLIDDICKELKKGKLYRAEQLIRRIICKILRNLGIKNENTDKSYSPAAVHKKLRDEYFETYSECIINLSRLDCINREKVDETIRALVTTLLHDDKLFEKLPESFMEKTVSQDTEAEHNLCSSYGVDIRFDTVHSVKGQTHTTTLYLETEYQKGSDLARILHLYGAGNGGSSPVYDYSRKLAYVGMSRPRELLCVAMQSKTYNKSKGVFNSDLWEVIDLRTS
ncbi:MAG: ATP-dependent helicase [Ruminococcus sp.]|uniref:UvrD-helicase domain-containing protein n=1 Tax=Ruminococcus sp. TaxID=41978 RepID=UPI0025DC7F7D|nr:UvrD-helicase domain-containing protein [Ruminococcus sp.]MBR6996228.1 ATP-dependent helicase [Ruminococcus sp.]